MCLEEFIKSFLQDSANKALNLFSIGRVADGQQDQNRNFNLFKLKPFTNTIFLTWIGKTK